MAVYQNLAPNSSLTSIELTPVSEGNFAFFHVAPDADKDEIKKWLTSKDVGQSIIAETQVDGHTVIITRGEKPRDDLLKSLEARGEKPQLLQHKQPFNFWALRGNMSIVGQSLQLSSSMLQVEKISADKLDKAGQIEKEGSRSELIKPGPKYVPELKKLFDEDLAKPKEQRTGVYVRKSFDHSVGIFAILNLVANFINIIYGGQKEKDENRLHHVKYEVNHKLVPYVLPGA